MPARLVHQHNAMRPWRDGLSEFSKEQVHRGSIEPGHHQGDTGVACRAHGPDDPSRLVADIAQPARGMAALPPDIAGPPLLSDPRLVLAPDFKPLGFRMGLRDFRQAGSKPPFLRLAGPSRCSAGGAVGSSGATGPATTIVSASRSRCS